MDMEVLNAAPLISPHPFILAILSACETLYLPDNGIGFGYTETQIDSNTIKVNFKGNGVTSKEIVETYALYRCAETTLEHGYDYFVIVANNTDIKDQSVVLPATYTGSAFSNYSAHVYGTSYGATGYGTSLTNTYSSYTPPQVHNFRMYGSSVVIKMFKGEKPLGEMNAFDAHEVVKYMGKNIKRKY